jgi:hypothetical protein
MMDEVIQVLYRTKVYSVPCKPVLCRTKVYSVPCKPVVRYSCTVRGRLLPVLTQSTVLNVLRVI